MIFQVTKGQNKGEIFEAYEINNETGKIGGYKIWSTFGESNGYREFDLTDVQTKELKANVKTIWPAKKAADI